MLCDKCGSENLDWNSFCVKCGEPFGQVCHCRYVNRADDLYCGGCGRPIEAENAKNNRKQVSAEQPDPIEVQLTAGQINLLKKESFLLKVSKEKDVEQNELDVLFKNK